MESNIENIVNDQYEQYPYPERLPENERKVLFTSFMDDLNVVNCLCFKGKACFDQFRVLVAGGGTGDAVIYLAEQLRNFPNAQIIYCDLSKASMAVAQKRAAERKLVNITWLNKTLFDLEEYVGSFDYINCCGVLHHLEDPIAGLECLKKLLQPNGVISIMVYAQIGRTAVYQIQDLLKLIINDKSDLKEKINITKAVMKQLPESNLWNHAKNFIKDFDDGGDAGVVDLFLHAQDRAYTIPELYDFIANVNLNLIEFAMPERYKLLPESNGISGDLLKLINSQPEVIQQAIAERYCGDIIKYACFLSKSKDTRADFKDCDNIPSYHKLLFDREQFADQIEQSHYAEVNLTLGNGCIIKLQIGKFTAEIIRKIDGNRCLGEIYSLVKQKFGESSCIEEIERDFESMYKIMNKIDILLLRNKKCIKVRESDEIQEFVNNMYK